MKPTHHLYCVAQGACDKLPSNGTDIACNAMVLVSGISRTVVSVLHFFWPQGR